uniref:EF-hand domain-containing protein n=1 Tax=Alexandrium andersonii TaxID=327968 RepID=A0A7S2AVH4_9DINO
MDDYRTGSSSGQLPLEQRQAQGGVAFRTDLSSIGRSGSNRSFGGGGGGASILDEERRLIDKVFSIVDRDNSGTVDMEELKEMFRLFGVDSHFLTSAITRIMSNVDKDFDGMISPQEFYTLLSQKFEKGDPMSEIKSVFTRMDKNKDGHLDIDELHEVSQMLGENVSKREIKEMVKMFSMDYQEKKKKHEIERKKNQSTPAPEEPRWLDLNDFYTVMQEELD